MPKMLFGESEQSFKSFFISSALYLFDQNTVKLCDIIKI